MKKVKKQQKKKWDENKNTSQKKKKKKQTKQNQNAITKKIKKSVTKKQENDIEKLRNKIPKSSGIYKIINKITHNFYIGSAQNLHERLYRGHVKELRRKKHTNGHLQNAWNKYGESAFTFQIIEYCEDISKLIEREQYYLDTLLFAQEYIRNENKIFREIGYNICPTAGSNFGTGKYVLRYSLDGIFIDEWSTINQVKKVLKISGISSACKQNGQNTAGGFIWLYKTDKIIKRRIDVSKYNIKKSIPILQYDLNGNFIKEWDDIGEASRKNNSTKIYNILKKERKTACGFIWILKENDNFDKKISIEKYKRLTRAKKILQYNLDGIFINEWNSISEAAKKLNISNGDISDVCNNKKLTAGNFIWNFKENDNLPKIIDITNHYFYINKRKVLQYSLDGYFIKEWSSIKEAQEILNLTAISAVCRRKYKHCGGFFWKYKEGKKIEKKIEPIIIYKMDKKRTSILQYSLDGGFIKEWHSLKEISLKYKIKVSTIHRACSGKSKTCVNYVWRFNEGIIFKIIDTSFLKNNREIKKVLQFNLNDKLIKEWESVIDASKYYEIHEATIRKVCNGKLNTACGFKWKYKEEN